MQRSSSLQHAARRTLCALLAACAAVALIGCSTVPNVGPTRAGVLDGAKY